MSSCCESQVIVSDGKARVLLVGAPNTGKSTIFNLLTSGYAHPVNYAGSTVDFSEAPFRSDSGLDGVLVDTPGLISLNSHSPEQERTRRFLQQMPTRLLVVTVNASQLARHLHLVRQLQAAGHRLLVVVTMCDLLADRGFDLDAAALQAALQVPVVCVDNHRSEARQAIAAAIKSSIAAQDLPLPSPTPAAAAVDEARLRASYEELDALCQRLLKPRASAVRKRDLDRWLLHPVLGLFIFAAVMFGVFYAIFVIADPAIGAIESAFAWCKELLGTACMSGEGPAPWWLAMLQSGLLDGITAFAVFLPQILLLFLLMGWLEDSGYLARGAMLVDRPLQAIGLNGRSFLPLLSGYACAIPAMMAARTIRNPFERMLTIAVIPLMTCSARLPVYVLLVNFLTDDARLGGLVMCALYFASIVLGAVVATLISRFVRRDRSSSVLMLELPQMRRPILRVILRSTGQRAYEYVRRAGPTIVVIALGLWLLSSAPFVRDEKSGVLLPCDTPQSYAAAVARHSEPVMSPMGLDWRAFIAMISGFAAREVFVPALAVAYDVQVDEVDEEAQEDTLRANLLQRMRELKHEDSGLPIFTPASVLGLLFFFTMALQCFPTVAVARSETGSTKIAAAMLFGYTGLAWLGAVIIVQGLRACGIA